AWRQMVRLQAAPWTASEIKAARELRLAIVSIVFRQAEVRANLVDALAQPLSGAVAFFHGCDLMVRSGDNYSKQGLLEGLRRGLEALGRASAIVHNLRGFLRKDIAKQRKLDINAAVRNAVQIGAAGFERQGKGRIICDLAPALPQLIADGAQIQQAIANLIRNAIEAMAQGGVAVRELRVATALVEGGIEVLVADTGPGLPPEIAQAPFRFFATTKPNGLGLGLSICHSIIESHGGALHFETDAEGTRFRILLPAEPESEQEPGSDAA
ncbi:MAG TPA: ATP-binding protein, partial [Geobacterales bacterium]|nr:ATP-binding protein [Geobacterales bacterium]